MSYSLPRLSTARDETLMLVFRIPKSLFITETRVCVFKVRFHIQPHFVKEDQHVQTRSIFVSSQYANQSLYDYLTSHLHQYPSHTKHPK